MRINGIVLSSIIITNILTANPNQTAAERISIREAVVGLPKLAKNNDVIISINKMEINNIRQVVKIVASLEVEEEM